MLGGDDAVGCPTFFKLTCWGCGTQLSTLERKRTRAHQIDVTEQTERELAFSQHCGTCGYLGSEGTY